MLLNFRFVNWITSFFATVIGFLRWFRNEVLWTVDEIIIQIFFFCKIRSSCFSLPFDNFSTWSICSSFLLFYNHLTVLNYLTNQSLSHRNGFQWRCPHLRMQMRCSCLAIKSIKWIKKVDSHFGWLIEFTHKMKCKISYKCIFN